MIALVQSLFCSSYFCEADMTEQSLVKPTPWYYLPAVIIVAGCVVAMVNFGVRSTIR